MLDIYTEDLFNCPNDEYLGGIATRIWYASVNDFSNIHIPDSHTFEQRKTIDKKGITLYGGKSLKYIDVYLDKNALTEKTQGNIRRQKLISEFSFSILGMTARNTGFISMLKNTGLVFLIPDNNKKIWLFGTKKNTAYCSNAEALTGQKIDEDAIININYLAYTELFLYNGKISDVRVVGGFSSGFSKGFRV